MTDLSKGRILVTGGAGFIGSALIWALNQRGIENILVCDVLGHDEKWKNLVPLRFADYLEADELPARLSGEIRTIFHLGACSSTTETDASYLIRNNFEYTKTLAHFALENNCRFVYASSAATYGGLADRISESLPLENLRPLNMYGYSKHLFDCYARRAGILDRITGLKYFNVFGPNFAGTSINSRSTSYAAYGQATYSITDKARATAGARLSSDGLTADGESFYPIVPTFARGSVPVGYDPNKVCISGHKYLESVSGFLHPN